MSTRCSKCQAEKPLNVFSKSKRMASNDKLQKKCRSCERTYVQQ